jgi:hypothetical protein
MLLEYEVAGLPERDDLYEDMLDLGCGGQFYSAAYAAAPHLVRLARSASPLKAAVLLNTVAATAYFAGRDGSEPIEERFQRDIPMVFQEALSIAERVVGQLPDMPEARQLGLSIVLFRGDAESYRQGIEAI